MNFQFYPDYLGYGQISKYSTMSNSLDRRELNAPMNCGDPILAVLLGDRKWSSTNNNLINLTQAHKYYIYTNIS